MLTANLIVVIVLLIIVIAYQGQTQKHRANKNHGAHKTEQPYDYLQEDKMPAKNTGQYLELQAAFDGNKLVTFIQSTGDRRLRYPLFIDTGSEYAIIPNSYPWVGKHEVLNKTEDITFIDGNTESIHFINTELDINNTRHQLSVGAVHKNDSPDNLKIGTFGLCPSYYQITNEHDYNTSYSLVNQLNVSELHFDLRTQTPTVILATNGTLFDQIPRHKLVFRTSLMNYYDIFNKPDLDQQVQLNYYIITAQDQFDHTVNMIIDTGSPHTFIPQTYTANIPYQLKSEYGEVFEIPKDNLQAMPNNVFPPLTVDRIGILGIDSLKGYYICISFESRDLTIWK